MPETVPKIFIDHGRAFRRMPDGSVKRVRPVPPVPRATSVPTVVYSEVWRKAEVERKARERL